MVKQNDVKMFLLTLSNYQENLLQSYRAMFISSQTVVISIAALIAASAPQQHILLATLLILGGVLLACWKYITENRWRNVAYCHMQIEKLENGELTQEDIRNPFLSFKGWANNKSQKEKKEEIIAWKEDWFKDQTRRIMQTFLPIIYLIIWFIIISFELHQLGFLD